MVSTEAPREGAGQADKAGRNGHALPVIRQGRSLLGSELGDYLPSNGHRENGHISTTRSISIDHVLPSLPDAVQIARNPSDKTLSQRREELHELTRLKYILRHGTREVDGKQIDPFRFHGPDGFSMVAEAPGLEGFIFTEAKFRQAGGREASIAMLPYYYKYTLSLLNGAARTQSVREQIQSIRDSGKSPGEQYDSFISFLDKYVEGLRAKVVELDQAHWSHWSRSYHLFPRTWDMAGWRRAVGVPEQRMVSDRFFTNFIAADFLALRDLGFNTLRIMGTFPIGKIGAKGSAGGSPFAAQNFLVAPELGTRDEVAGFVSDAARHGIRIMFELVLNHTAIDSDLVLKNPRLFVHTRTEPPAGELENYYHFVSPEHGEFWIRYGGHIDEATGKRAYFRDTLQLDLTNHETRDLLIDRTKDMVRMYGVQGFRIDMAYKLRNELYRSCWGTELANPAVGQREFLEELITAIKVAFPGVAFAAEAFHGWDGLSEDNCDLIYGLSDMALRGGATHLGWHSALLSSDPIKLRQALLRTEYLNWQEGGADMLLFWGQHDQPAFWETLGPNWKWGAFFVTAHLPGALSVMAGIEAEHSDPCSEDNKVVSFNRLSKIDWDGAKKDFGKFQLATLRRFRALEVQWGRMHHEVLPVPAGEHWIGYTLQPVDAKPSDPKVVVLVNPTQQPTSVTINQPERGMRVNCVLPACGPEGVELLWIP